MSPTQYRALEALADAAPGRMRVSREPRAIPGRIHPRTADALVRRGLADRIHLDGGEEALEITDDGFALLDARPTPLTR